MEVLGIIPARGGSKGIPRKNIRELAGKPLLYWMLSAAKNAKRVTRIIVSTDDEEIAAVARAHGAEVPFMRPQDISGDLATDVEFLDHAVDWLFTHEGYQPDILLRLPPTYPLCTSDDIDTAVKLLIDTPEAHAVRPIVESPKHPYKMWKISEKDARFIEPFLSKDHTGFDEPHNLPRQLFPKVYVHTGAMDVLWLKTLKELRSTSGTKTAYFHMDPESYVNIDSPLDFMLAEVLLNQRYASSTSE